MSESSNAHQPNSPDRDGTNEQATDPVAEETKASEREPGVKTVVDFMLYGLSIPERTLRSTVAMAGGLVRETTDLIIPQAFRDSRTYRSFIEQLLDFWVQDIGGVEQPKDKESMTDVENYVARKAICNLIELASLATLHLSPLTVLAIVSDVAYGSKTYLRELSKELKQQGVIDEHSTIDSAADLLSAVSDASGKTSKAFDIPPLSVDGLKETIKQTKEAVKSIKPTQIIPQQEIKRLWDEIHVTATQQEMSILEVGGAMTMYTINKIGKVGKGALSTVRVAGNLFDKHIFDFYTDSLIDITNKGIFTSVAESSKPYIEAIWKNFSTEKDTVTEGMFSGRLLARCWRWFCRLFRRKKVKRKDDLQEDSAQSQA